MGRRVTLAQCRLQSRECACHNQLYVMRALPIPGTTALVRLTGMHSKIRLPGCAAIPQPMRAEVASRPVHLLCCLSPIVRGSTGRPETCSLALQVCAHRPGHSEADGGGHHRQGDHHQSGPAQLFQHGRPRQWDHPGAPAHHQRVCPCSHVDTIVDSCHCHMAPAVMSCRECRSPAGRGFSIQAAAGASF